MVYSFPRSYTHQSVLNQYYTAKWEQKEKRDLSPVLAIRVARISQYLHGTHRSPR